MLCMKHQWSKHSNTRDLRQHLGRSQRHICCFPDHIRCLQHFGAWSSCFVCSFFSSWRICPFKMSLFATEFTNCILSWKLVTEWTSSLHQTQDSIWLLAVCIWFGLKLLFPVSIPLQSSNQLLYLKTNQKAYSDTSALYKETCFSVMALALLLSSCEKSYTCNWRKDKTRQDNFI